MAIPFRQDIDLGLSQLLNAVVQVLAVAPDHAAGRIYYDSVMEALRISDGTAWTTLGAPGESPVSSVNTKTGEVVLDPDDLDDSSTTNKFVTASDVTALGTLASDLAAKAPLASPTFTGNPTAPTPATSDNDTSIATTAYVKAVIDALLNGASSAADTLKELEDLIAAADGDLDGVIATLATKPDKYTETIGDGAETDIVVTHNLGSRDLAVSARLAASPYTIQYVEVEFTTTNTATVKFASAPATDEIVITFIG